MNKQLKKYLSLMALTGALFSAGCSNNEQEPSYYQEYTEAIKNGKTKEDAYREFTLKRADDERKADKALDQSLMIISGIIMASLLLKSNSRKVIIEKMPSRGKERD